MPNPNAAANQASKPVNGSVFPLGSFRFDVVLEPVLAADVAGGALEVVVVVLVAVVPVGAGTVGLGVVGLLVAGVVVALPVWVLLLLWW